MKIALPGFHGVHQLSAVFHDARFVEENHRVSGSEFVGAAQVVECRGAVIFAARRDASLKISRRIVGQQGCRDRAGSNQAVQNIDSGVVFFVEQIGASLQLQPVRVCGRLLEFALDFRTGRQQL